MADKIEKCLEFLREAFSPNNWMILQIGHQIFIHGPRPHRSFLKPDTLAVVELDEKGAPKVNQGPAGAKPFTILIESVLEKIPEE